MESEFPSNSQNPRRKATEGVPDKTPKKHEKRVEKVVSGTVLRRKKPLHKRIKERLTGGEDAGSVLEYVFFDIILEASKDIALDAFNAGLERKFYGEVRSRGRRGYNRGIGHTRTDYNRISTGSVLRNDPRGLPEPRMSRRGRATHDFGEIVLPTRVEATTVLDVLFSALEKFEIVTVADLYDALGEDANFQDFKFGWDDLRGADVERVRDGYLLILPPPQHIS